MPSPSTPQQASTPAPLPTLYAPWLNQITGNRGIPRETVADCEACVMLAPQGQASTAEYFLPETRCCAYQPTLPNYLVGLVLSDPEAGLDGGRAALAQRIASQVGVTPSGVQASGVFKLLYSQTPRVFGRAPALKCPYLSCNGCGCGIWQHRPAACATWYCKHVRGAIGFRFWQRCGGLLQEVEAELALWCAAELGAGTTEWDISDPHASDKPQVSELGAPVDDAAYRRRWGTWAGREQAYYRACAERVRPLAWADVASICGPRVRILAEQVAAAHREGLSFEVPDRLRLYRMEVLPSAQGRLRVVTYSGYDPLTLPDGLIDALRAFDGRPTDEALQTIRSDRGLELDLQLVRRLIDFDILKKVDGD